MRKQHGKQFVDTGTAHPGEHEVSNNNRFGGQNLGSVERSKEISTISDLEADIPGHSCLDLSTETH